MAPRLIADSIRELLPMKRSPGNHVSEIINRLCVKLGKWEDDGSRPAQIQLEMGNCMEDALGRALAERFHRDQPGRYIHGFELEKDRITGNADLIDTVDFVVEECKLTKRSIRHDIEDDKFVHNWWQLQAYCHMLGTNTGRLHLTFVNGNYKYPDQPGFDEYLSGWQYRCYEDTWTDKELANIWRMITGHRRKDLDAGLNR